MSAVDGAASSEPTWESRVLDRSIKRTEELARARALSSTRKIVDAAIELTQEKPGEPFTLQQVVDRAGVALQTVYRHFGSKDELMLAVVEELSRAEIQRIEEQVVGATDSLSRLRLAVMIPVQKAIAAVPGSVAASVARELRRLQETHAHELARLIAPYYTFVEQAIVEAAADGRIAPEDPRRDAQLILGITAEILNDVSCGSVMYDLDGDPDYWWRFCLRALGADAEVLAAAQAERTAASA